MNNPSLIVKNTHKYGKGVFAKQNIKKGEFIASFNGKIYTCEPENKLSNKPPKYIEEHVIQFARDKYRDSKGVARILNHSCNPNCGIKNKFKLVSMRNIKKGEELTWDYATTDNWDYATTDNLLYKEKCKCESKICRKTIRGYRFLPKHIRREYKGYISDWLVKK